MKSQIWTVVRSDGSFWTSLMMSAHRGGTRRRAVDEDHRNPAGPIRVHHDQAVAEHVASSAEEPAELGVPDRSALQAQRQGGGGVQLEGHDDTFGFHGGRVVDRVQIDDAANLTGVEAFPDVRQVNERRDRHLHPGRNTLPRFLCPGSIDRLHLGGEWNAQAGLTIPVLHAAHLVVDEGNEADQAITAPQELLGTVLQLQGPEWKREREDLWILARHPDRGRAGNRGGEQDGEQRAARQRSTDRAGEPLRLHPLPL
jgi:hypothetical protein